MSISRSAVLLASAARTATPTPISLNDGEFQSKGSGKSFIKINPSILDNFHIIIDVSEINLTPSIVVTIEAFNEATGNYYSLLDSLAITTVSTTVLKIGKNVVESTNASAQDFIPKDTRIKIVHEDADSITYSIGINYQES